MRYRKYPGQISRILDRNNYIPSDNEKQRNGHRFRKILVIPESSDESSAEEANDGISAKEGTFFKFRNIY